MRRSSFLSFDWQLILPVVILAAISLTTLFSLSAGLFQSQLIYYIVGFVAFLIISQTNYRMYNASALLIYLVSVVLLLLVLFFGFESRGATRWFALFGVQLQVSEIIKPFLTLIFAGFLASQQARTLKSFIVSILLISPIAFLITIQPDLGNALIFVGVGFLILLVFGYPIWWFIIGILPFLIGSPFIWNLLHDYQRQRILTFVHPTSDPQGTSYNLIQAVIAVGSGMFVGRGIGEGTQSGLRFLPERHTDFIFATLSEGFGFVGSAIVIIAFVFLFYRILIIYRDADDMMGKLYASGTFFFLLVHFFVNSGMNLGLLPIVGVTLPFVSFGGSSILTNFIFLGLLSSVGRTRRKLDTLEIR